MTTDSKGQFLVKELPFDTYLVTEVETDGFDLPKTGDTGTLVTTICGVVLVRVRMA